MQLIVVLTALLLTAAQAADVCGDTGSTCNGTRRCCAGIAAGRCCNFGASTSVWFVLPARSRGQAWTNSDCTGNSLTFSTSSAVSVCQRWTGRGSGRWLEGTSLVKSRSEANAAGADEDCAEPNAFFTADGKEFTLDEARAAGLLDEE